MKVLHLVSRLSINSGLMSVIMNYYRRIDRKEVQFGFLYFTEDRSEDYKSEIKELGGKIYFFNINKWRLKESFRTAFSDLKEKYDVFHVHELYLLFAAEKTARQSGVKAIIGHAHTIKYSEKFFSGIRNRITCLGINRRCDYEVACSRDAGKLFFGNDIHTGKFNIINNAIKLGEYHFDSEKRLRIRNNLGLTEKNFVVGHVGRFTHPKNHPFIIELFKEIWKNKEYSRLLLIGEGPCEDRIKELVRKNKLEDMVIFLGSRKDVNDLYSAMDVFLFPSLYEGLGSAVVEAQANGLPCFVSNTVPLQAKVLGSYKIFDLKDGPEKWAEKILNADLTRNNDSYDLMTGAGFNIDIECKKLKDLYQMMIGA